MVDWNPFLIAVPFSSHVWKKKYCVSQYSLFVIFWNVATTGWVCTLTLKTSILSTVWRCATLATACGRLPKHSNLCIRSEVLEHCHVTACLTWNKVLWIFICSNTTVITVVSVITNFCTFELSPELTRRNHIHVHIADSIHHALLGDVGKSCNDTRGR